MSNESPGRRVLVLAHTGRAEVREVARACVRSLTEHGIAVRLLVGEAADLGLQEAAGLVETTLPDDLPGEGCELVLVIGGDGSILRAAELTRETSTPLLGVNLGHVGFLAEAEQDDVPSTIAAIVRRDYTAEDRLTLDVRVLMGKEIVFSTFALNEASVEKASRERMLEVVVEVDGRPLSRWGCDGVVCATPDGLDRLQLQRRRTRSCGRRSRPC